jgi:hypothetical protein
MLLDVEERLAPFSRNSVIAETLVSMAQIMMR